ncbi:MAG: hypothetical protein CMD49_03540, partial [Gammaproteobacteria bacterium]|nr:hypothetical protein [Gammaproteobacteria bacterium]
KNYYLYNLFDMIGLILNKKIYYNNNFTFPKQLEEDLKNLFNNKQPCIGIAPGANLGDKIALFEATHGTAPKYTGLDKVNPGSLILSAEMMLRYMGWNQAADYVLNGVKGAIRNKQLTYDLARARAGRRVIRTKTRDKTPRTTEEVKQEMSKLVPGAWLVTTSGFGEAVINNM